MTVVKRLFSSRRRSALVRGRLLRRAALSIALAVAAVLTLPMAAQAHAELESTTPVNGAVLTASPPSVDLHFSESVEIALGSVQVLDAVEHRVDLGDTHHPGGRGSDVEVSLRRDLAKGTYLVRWRVVSSDSHPINGALVFSVGTPGAVAQGTAADADRVVELGLGVARFVDFTALALLIGGALFVGWCWPAGAAEPRVRRLLAVGWWAAVLASLGGLLLEGPYGAGLGLSSLLDPATMHGAVNTRFGHAQLARLGLLLVGASLLLASARRLTTQGRLPLPLALAGGGLAIGVLATVSVAGHAADGSDAWLAVPADIAHLAAMAAWLGGLATLAVCLLFRSRTSARDLRAAVPRFSRLAAGCVVVLIATGVYAAWRDLGGWGALTGTEQGVLLLVKLAVVVVLLNAAAFSRSWVRARTAAQARGSWSELRGMRWSVGAESALAAGVLAVTAALVAVPPGRNEWRPASSFDLTAGPVRVQLSVVPLGPNRLDLYAYTFTETGQPRDVPEVTATADGPDRNVAGLPVRFLNAGPGRFLANGVTLPTSGQWTVDLHVRTSNIDEYSATARFDVR